MPWHGTRKYAYSLVEIVQYAPGRSGVYALYSGEAWICIGQSADVGASLRRHCNGDDLGIQRDRPTHFAFEVIPVKRRVARQQELIREFDPACNQGAGRTGCCAHRSGGMGLG